MAQYKGVFYKNSEVVPGVLVRLYNDSEVKSGADTTNQYGQYTFENIEPGNYQVRFFGEDCTEADWIYVTVTGVSAADAIAIVFSGSPALNASEGAYDYEIQGEISSVTASLTYLGTSAGTIREVLIEYKESSGSSWNILKNFTFDSSMSEVSSDSTSANYTSSITLKSKPVDYDFRASFYNGSGVPAKSSGNIIYATSSNVTFNGIPDLNEYVGVDSVTVKNSNVSGDAIPTNQIILEWEDPRETGAGTYQDAAGNNVSLSDDQLNNINGYVLYMFISDSGDLPSGGENFPAKTETNGTWYLLSTQAADVNSATIRLPQNNKIMVWVGFKTKGVVTSATSEYYNY